MTIFASLIIFFAEMLIAYIFFSRIADKKLSEIKIFSIGTALFEAGATINIIGLNTIWINVFVFFLINALFLILCFDIKLSKAVFYAVIMDVFAIALEFATIFIISIIFDSAIDGYKTSPVLLIFDTAISKVLYLIVCLILSRIIGKNENTAKFSLSLFIYPLINIATLTIFWYICATGNLSDSVQTMLAIVSLLLFAATVVLFITYRHNLDKENQIILLNSELSRLQTEKTHYDVLEHQNRQLLLYAHDAKKHLLTIKGLNTNPAVDKYINEMTDNLLKYSKVCQSGNITLDAIINRYKSQCELNNIEFYFNVKVCNLDFINDFDLVTVLGNIMDNAFEAAEKCKKKSISTETFIQNNYAVAIVKNSCEAMPLMKNNAPVTTKRNKSVHGLGLKNAMRAIKKYGGDIFYEYDSENELFITTATFGIIP